MQLTSLNINNRLWYIYVHINSSKYSCFNLSEYKTVITLIRDDFHSIQRPRKWIGFSVRKPSASKRDRQACVFNREEETKITSGAGSSGMLETSASVSSTAASSPSAFEPASSTSESCSLEMSSSSYSTLRDLVRFFGLAAVCFRLLDISSRCVTGTCNCLKKRFRSSRTEKGSWQVFDGLLNGVSHWRAAMTFIDVMALRERAASPTANRQQKRSHLALKNHNKTTLPR